MKKAANDLDQLRIRLLLQYCAKVMRMIIDEYRNMSAIFNAYINLKQYIEQYIVTAIVLFFGEISLPVSEISFTHCNILFPVSDISFLLSNISFPLSDISYLCRDISFLLA